MIHAMLSARQRRMFFFLFSTRKSVRTGKGCVCVWGGGRAAVGSNLTGVFFETERRNDQHVGIRRAGCTLPCCPTFGEQLTSNPTACRYAVP